MFPKPGTPTVSVYQSRTSAETIDIFYPGALMGADARQGGGGGGWSINQWSKRRFSLISGQKHRGDKLMSEQMLWFSSVTVLPFSPRLALFNLVHHHSVTENAK